VELLDGLVSAMRFARLFPKLITLEPPPCTWFMRKIQKPIRITNGRTLMRSAHQADDPVPFESNFTFCFSRRFWNCVADCVVG
jgi:hypothetical protein